MSEDRKRGDGGFWDFVMDPAYRKWIGSRLDKIPRPGRMSSSPKAIRSAVKQIRDGTRHSERAFERLLELGEVAVPFLVEALNDPSLDATVPPEAPSNKAPLEFILDLLEPFGPSEAVGPLIARMSSPDNVVRKLAIMALGNIGTEACRESLEAAMSDGNEYVRAYAVMGLRYAIEAGRASPALLDGLFDPLVRLLSHPDGFNTTGEATSALLEIDRERAIPILLGKEVLGSANDYVYKIIRSLNEVGVIIPGPRLRVLLDELRPDAQSYPHDSSYGAALIALARSGDPGAEEIIREALTWESEQVSENAAQALGILDGIGEPIGFIEELAEKHGFKTLTEPQMRYFAVFSFHYQVLNGGLPQYFANWYGQHAREALEGLEAMEAMTSASVLRRAMALFGPDGPSRDDDSRHQQLAALGEAQFDAMEALSQEYYQSGDRIKVKLPTYVRAFKSHFQGKEPD